MSFRAITVPRLSCVWNVCVKVQNSKVTAVCRRMAERSTVKVTIIVPERRKSLAGINQNMQLSEDPVSSKRNGEQQKQMSSMRSMRNT